MLLLYCTEVVTVESRYSQPVGHSKRPHRLTALKMKIVSHKDFWCAVIINKMKLNTIKYNTIIIKLLTEGNIRSFWPIKVPLRHKNGFSAYS